MNRNAPIPLTREGIAKLEEELAELVNVRRPALAERLRQAIAQGDLSENADYITAKEEQGFLEGRIQQVEMMLRHAVVIDKGEPTGRVQLGRQVTVVEEGIEGEEVFHMVGPAEADPSQGRISFESPLGGALLDHEVGDTVRVEAPAGEIFFRIISID